MGASGWYYRVAFQPSAEAALVKLQEQILASHDYLWIGEDDERPRSLEQLADIKDDEEFWAEGTHSILDVDRIVAVAAKDQDGSVRPLSVAEVRGLLGSDRPSAADFERAFAGGMGAVADVNRNWSGRCTVLYAGDRPSEYAFWGMSGD
jgi:hypothetical protein